jgi:hypothetical protein
MKLSQVVGPHCLCQYTDTDDHRSFPFIELDSDAEIGPLCTNIDTEHISFTFGTERFERFSNWKAEIKPLLVDSKSPIVSKAQLLRTSVLV